MSNRSPILYRREVGRPRQHNSKRMMAKIEMEMEMGMERVLDTSDGFDPVKAEAAAVACGYC